MRASALLACVYAPQALPIPQLGVPQDEEGRDLQRQPHSRRGSDQLELAASEPSTKPLSITDEVSNFAAQSLEGQWVGFRVEFKHVRCLEMHRWTNRLHPE